MTTSRPQPENERPLDTDLDAENQEFDFSRTPRGIARRVFIDAQGSHSLVPDEQHRQLKNAARARRTAG